MHAVRTAPLPYPYGALEPTIDELTMRIHHDKHHGGPAVASTANQDSPLMQRDTPRLGVHGEASTGEQAVAEASRLRPDVVLTHGLALRNPA